MKGNFNRLINSPIPVLIDFYADWCGPCHALAPHLKKAASELSGRVKVVKIDVDKNPSIAGKYNVQGIPTMVLFKNGQPVWRQSGVISKDQIVQAVSGNI